ncbi:uncharacterized protein DSM5745_00330 [Aspergillus mulundensis]|uniref:Aminoglycoside phosphotransferase domain-containing protein n=1 Tax=Aspergillus mulundensis TaxID=1810919 RepID=A0A3D8T4T5_9EURO|nr:Uncharacterized protein DSM5745_00330 [Aspergillus mulundensis]RDW93008.1 Uncharacterized protein DSM5745_00330 [Aspergillus mulundensis]
MPEIINDRDLPRILSTPTKQIKFAKKLVAEQLGVTVKRGGVLRAPIQGMFSRTHFLKLSDGREIAQQFRTEPLDLASFITARKVLGCVVPEVIALESEELRKEGVWAYSLTRILGQTWLRGVAGKGAEGRVAINKSLGQVFAKGFMAATSEKAVEEHVRPHLEAILASEQEEVIAYRPHVQAMADKLDELKKFPLWIAHYDLNDVNILIDDDCNVTGLVDWELSTPLPFGAGLGRIHTIAGEYHDGEFWMPDEFEDAERAFWNGLFDGMDINVREMLEKNIDLVQDAVQLGTLLDCFFFLDGKVGFSPVSLKAFPKFLTYRIPFVRGDEGPYSSEV